MGTEYYLVDSAGKTVLGCGKWYALDVGYGQEVTTEAIAAADPHPGVWAWWREQAGGRKIVVITDSAGMEPWIDHDDPYQRWLPGWRVFELVGAAEVLEVRPPEVPKKKRYAESPEWANRIGTLPSPEEVVRSYTHPPAPTGQGDVTGLAGPWWPGVGDPVVEVDDG